MSQVNSNLAGVEPLNNTSKKRRLDSSQNNFIPPIQMSQGSPSKNRNPRGANKLPIASENAIELTTTNFGSPLKSGHQNATSTPLSLGKSNSMTFDNSYSGGPMMLDDSIIHKSTVSPSSPSRKQEKENTALTPCLNMETIQPQTQAAISHQEIYRPKQNELLMQVITLLRQLSNPTFYSRVEQAVLEKPSQNGGLESQFNTSSLGLEQQLEWMTIGSGSKCYLQCP